MGDLEFGDIGRQPRPAQIGNVPGEHVERPYSAVLALQDACHESKCQIDGVTRFRSNAQIDRAVDKAVFENGTFDIHCTPRPASASRRSPDPLRDATYLAPGPGA